MGTVFSFDLRDPPTPDIRHALDRAVTWLHRVDEVFSTYRPGSQISRLARGEVTLADCDRDVTEVLRLCESAQRPANAAALRLVRSSLSHSRTAAVRLAWWTLVSAVPALVSGKALALAVDEGFLTHHLPTAVLHLSVCALGALGALGGAWAGRQTYPPLADIVEPLRDRLHRDVVRGTLRRAVARGAPREGADAVVVAQLARQVEVVRDTVAGELMLV
ncbi:FAD:protein FMN transferase [Streptomyces sp. IBSBF 3352]|uniref:FAD:protein FMN transferase n=1 Tax=Streptomyces sp. IBSBF 3352 TaxID=2903523 RepID=UPI002FDC1223